ncbi:small-conductance mechanosensitive channel [Cyclobacterium qasimii M12-11B]|uniref:Small-conductance mechanosensitive channel n=2 Tax=Cyclobacterium qasimii TaxID=1350429 RepID=S7V902_9BACT|nr:small-conductance mechanosensitive channel [Cyclobacterium qasimii M12-11B]
MYTTTSTYIGKMSWLSYSVAFLACLMLGLALQWVIYTLFKASNTKSPTVLKTQLLKHLKKPSKFLVSILLIFIYLNFLELTDIWYRLIEAIIIINCMWLLIEFLRSVEKDIQHKFEKATGHNSKDRKILTQIRFIKNMAFIIIVTHAITLILWNIPTTKKIGETILTSSGIIGVNSGPLVQKPMVDLLVTETNEPTSKY